MHPLHLPCRSRVKVKVDESMTERIELPAIEFVGIIARRLVRGMPMPVRALTRDCAPLSSAQSTYCTCRHVFTGIACGALVLTPACHSTFLRHDIPRLLPGGEAAKESSTAFRAVDVSTGKRSCEGGGKGGMGWECLGCSILSPGAFEARLPSPSAMVVASRRGQRRLPGREGALRDSNPPLAHASTHARSTCTHTRAHALVRDPACSCWPGPLLMC